jgi:tetratricopeptide (TPR) repeat protein
LAACVGQLAPGAATLAAPISDAEVGSAMARAAVLDLGLRASPGPLDYEAAGTLLREAARLRPDDAELARLIAASAWSAGDQELLMEATRTIVRTDPTDTVAQLRLISANINARQTVEARLEAFERFLGPAGRTLDPSVRSRLALDCALLLREGGDNEGFERRLREAVELDPTNKDAVSMAARVFSSGDVTVAELTAWQIRLLNADPLDPHVHLTLAKICAAQGAIEPAVRFLENALRLFGMNGADLPVELRAMRLAFTWQREGASEVIEPLNAALKDRRDEEILVTQRRLEAGEPISDLLKPEEIRYAESIDRIRLFAAHSIGDADTVATTLTDLGLETADLFTTIGEEMAKQNADQIGLFNELIRVFSEFQVARAIVGREVELIGPQTQALFGEVPGAMDLLAPLKAWVAYAEGDNIGALDLLGEPRAGTSDDFLVALVSDRLGDVERAAPIFQRYAQRASGTAYGALARMRLRAMGRESGILTPEGRQLESALSKVPEWLDRMTMDPRSFMLLQVETPSDTHGPNEPTLLRIRLRNASAIPLGLGSSRPIGSRMLISVRPISQMADFAGAPTAKVLELDRRLRLEPLQELDVVVEADSAYASWLREVNAHVSMRDRYRVLQSFQPSPRGGLINAPLALVSQSPMVHRVPLDMARLDAGEIERAVRSGDAEDLRSALIATVARTIEPGAGLGLEPAQRTSLARAWADRFEAAGVSERTLMLLRLPHARQVPEMRVFDIAAVDAVLADAAAADPAGSVNSGLLAATMLTRINDPENAVFELAARTDDPRLRRLGDRLRARLLGSERAFSNAPPGAGGLAPAGQDGSMDFGT